VVPVRVEWWGPNDDNIWVFLVVGYIIIMESKFKSAFGDQPLKAILGCGSSELIRNQRRYLLEIQLTTEAHCSGNNVMQVTFEQTSASSLSS
jgi:hypothetical protein